MARNVRISTLGAVAPMAKADEPYGEAVDRMIGFWEGKLKHVLPDEPDLILLPEACDRYQEHTDQQIIEYYEARGDKIRDYFCSVADKHNCYIVYSAIHKLDDGTWRNALQVIDRDGKVIGAYNKCHPVEPECENAGIMSGYSAKVIECDFGTIGGAICFDLNFDVLRAQYQKLRPDVMLFSSVYHGGLMQPYWAYSCRSHFVSCIGGYTHCPSHFIAPNGRIVGSTTNYLDYATQTLNLDCALIHLDFNWEQLDELKSKYGRSITIDDTGHLASVLLTNHSDERTVDDLVKEANMTLLDDYFVRAMKVQAAHREPAC